MVCQRTFEFPPSRRQDLMDSREALHSNGDYDHASAAWRPCVSRVELFVQRDVYGECGGRLHDWSSRVLLGDKHNPRRLYGLSVPTVHSGRLQGKQQVDSKPWFALRPGNALEAKDRRCLKLRCWIAIQAVSNC